MKLVRILCLFLSLFVFYVSDAFLSEENPRVLLKRANQFYSEKKYEKALCGYLLLEDIYGKSPELFYNISACYYRLHNLGKSILYARKGFLLKPRDKEIRRNLDFLNSLVGKKIEDRRNWYIRQYDKLLGFFTYLELEIASLIILGVFLIFLGFYFLSGKKENLLSSAVILLILFILFFVSFLFKKYMFSDIDNAIVISETVAYKNPYAIGDTVFDLEEGMSVKIADRKADWVKVVLLNGAEGWISDKSINKIMG